MQIKLYVEGDFKINVFDLDGNPVEDEKELRDILSKLQTIEYVIGIQSREIYDINELDKALYTFETETGVQTSYDFFEEQE